MSWAAKDWDSRPRIARVLTRRKNQLQLLILEAMASSRCLDGVVMTT